MLKKFNLHGRIIITGLIATLLLATPVYAFIGHRAINAVYSNIKIFFNDEEVEMLDESDSVVHAFFADGQIYVPINLFAAAVGGFVDWDESTAVLIIDMPLREIDETEEEEEIEEEIDFGEQPFVPLVSVDYFNQGGGRLWRINEKMPLNTGVAANGFVGMRMWAATHNSSIEYFLEGQFGVFTGSVALNHDTRSAITRVKIRIFGDDILKFESNEITAGFLPFEFAVDVRGVNIMRIETVHLTGTDWIHVGIADGILHKIVEETANNTNNNYNNNNNGYDAP